MLDSNGAVGRNDAAGSGCADTIVIRPATDDALLVNPGKGYVQYYGTDEKYTYHTLRKFRDATNTEPKCHLSDVHPDLDGSRPGFDRNRFRS